MKKNRTMLHILHTSKSTKIEQESSDIEERFESKRKGGKEAERVFSLSFFLIHFVEEYHTRFNKKKRSLNIISFKLLNLKLHTYNFSKCAYDAKEPSFASMN